MPSGHHAGPLGRIDLAEQHPELVAAQARQRELNGALRTYFCGAYWRFGFHEDGVQSARRVLVAMGVEPGIPARAEELRPGVAEMPGAAPREAWRLATTSGMHPSS